MYLLLLLCKYMPGAGFHGSDASSCEFVLASENQPLHRFIKKEKLKYHMVNNFFLNIVWS